MKKYIVLLMAVFAIGIYAAQDASLTIRQVRDPVQLREKLNANAADAESRLIAAAITNGIATMEGGATLDNTSSAAELNITETTVKITGALAVTGATTLTTKLAQSNIATNNLGALTLVVLSTDGKTNTLSYSAIGILTNNVITP